MADQPSPSSSNLGAVVTAIASVAGALLVFAGGFATAWFSSQSKDQELRVHLVEIAIGILRADPKEDVGPARGWALDVIEKNSGVPFSEQDRQALLHKPLADKAPAFSPSAFSPAAFSSLMQQKGWVDANFEPSPEVQKLMNSPEMQKLVKEVLKDKSFLEVPKPTDTAPQGVSGDGK